MNAHIHTQRLDGSRDTCTATGSSRSNVNVARHEFLNDKVWSKCRPSALCALLVLLACCLLYATLCAYSCTFRTARPAGQRQRRKSDGSFDTRQLSTCIV